jgi:hypothetical protein
MPSITKLIVLAVVIFIVWRFFTRLGQASRRTQDSAERTNRPTGDGPRPIEDMVKCPKCGAYVPQQGDHRCES